MQSGVKSLIKRRELIGGGFACWTLASLAQNSLVIAAPRGTNARNGSGLLSSALKRIDDTMNSMVERKETPGMVGLIYRRGEVAHVTTAGWQDIESKKPMRRDTIFQIMSMTKPITAVATLILVDDGRLNLYDPVEKFLPEFANGRVLRTPSSPLDDTVASVRPMQIVDLLTFRSGIVSSPPPGSPGPMTPLEKAVGTINSSYEHEPAEWLKAIAELPKGTQPGTTWHYGTASEVLTFLVSRLSGMTYSDFVQRRIFDPLGMKDTAYFVPAEKISRFSTAYQRDSTTHEIQPLTGFFSTLRPTQTPPIFPKGGYGLVSTVDDYLQFARMLLGHGEKGGVRILSHRTTSLMASNYLTLEQRRAVPLLGDSLFRGQGWGLGLAVVVDPTQQDEFVGFASEGAFGWPGALGTWWQADPKEDMIQIYMNQFLTYGTKDLPRFAFQNLGYEAIDD